MIKCCFGWDPFGRIIYQHFLHQSRITIKSLQNVENNREMYHAPGFRLSFAKEQPMLAIDMHDWALRKAQILKSEVISFHMYTICNHRHNLYFQSLALSFARRQLPTFFYNLRLRAIVFWGLSLHYGESIHALSQESRQIIAQLGKFLDQLRIHTYCTIPPLHHLFCKPPTLLTKPYNNDHGSMDENSFGQEGHNSSQIFFSHVFIYQLFKCQQG